MYALPPTHPCRILWQWLCPYYRRNPHHRILTTESPSLCYQCDPLPKVGYAGSSRKGRGLPSQSESVLLLPPAGGTPHRRAVDQLWAVRRILCTGGTDALAAAAHHRGHRVAKPHLMRKPSPGWALCPTQSANCEDYSRLQG